MTLLRLPAPPGNSRAILLWLLTRLIGGIAFFWLLFWATDAATPAPSANTNDHEWGDALGPAVAMWMGWFWAVLFDFFCSLPLLLGAPGSIGRALQVPDGPVRRRRFFGAIIQWQVLPAVAAALAFGLVSLVAWLPLLLLLAVVPYLLVALAVARLLYGYWLADYYCFAETA